MGPCLGCSREYAAAEGWDWALVEFLDGELPHLSSPRCNTESSVGWTIPRILSQSSTTSQPHRELEQQGRSPGSNNPSPRRVRVPLPHTFPRRTAITIPIFHRKNSIHKGYLLSTYCTGHWAKNFTCALSVNYDHLGSERSSSSSGVRGLL